MDSADDLTFRIIFSGDGAGMLRDRVKEKLKEFMGDYTDDTLVEYVIVLLKNGRCKAEARNELNVFLGDDSDSFVSWLWDHLGSNLDLYTQQKPQYVKEDGRSESEGMKSDKLSTNRRSKDWRGVIRDTEEPPALRSTVITNLHADDESHLKQSRSPDQLVHRKRGRSDETGQTDERSLVKREIVSKPTLGASRRLLQFAMRDAVVTSKPTGLTSELSNKRLRSVVSTPNGDSLPGERHPKFGSDSRVPKAMAVAVKAVADAAKDAVKIKPSRNVFDRIGRSIESPEDDEHVGLSQIIDTTIPTYSGQYTADVPMVEHSDGIASEFAYVNEGRNRMNTQIGKSDGRLGDDSMMLNYNAAKVVDRNPKKPYRDQNSPVSMVTGLGVGNYNDYVTVSNGNVVPTIHAQPEIPKTLSSNDVNSAGQPTENVDSRTIYVSNVHFAATKDSLTQHFNKFGDVLKVVIVSDSATGQPKGSAYVEFMRKESAENALSLDGTSFMSRILKVVRKSCGQPETAPVTTWAPRASPFAAASRFGHPRGIPNIYRSRIPIKTGARSFQWKRDDAQNTPPPDSIQSPATILSPTTRSLTYVRTEAKTSGNS